MLAAALHRAGRGVAAAAVGAAVSTSLVVAAPSASADALDDGQWWRAAMGVDELHRSGSGKGVTVALIDGPVDSSVPELKGRVASSWTQCLAPGGGRQSPTAKGVAADHATRMASLIVGSGKGTASGGRGISGIAPDATLRHYAVTYPSTADVTRLNCGLTDPSVNQTAKAVAGAIRQAAKDGAKVISISLTADYDDEFVPALLDAYRAGAIVVASTNNETRKVFWPGIGNGVVTVTHVDARGNLDDSAMRKSDFVDFSAPGTKIAAGQWTSSGWRSDVVSDGSSQATAITAGGLAAMWSAHPQASGNQILQAAKDAIGLRAEGGKFLTWFRRVGANLPKATGKTESYGFGIMAPADAVKLDVESLPDTNPMIADKGVVLPTAEEIAAVTTTAATPSPSTSTTPGSVQPSSTATADASGASGATDTAEESESGSSVAAWLVGGAVVLALLGGVTFLRRRSARTSHDGARTADASRAARPARRHDPQHLQDTHDTHDTHDMHDTPAAADGAAATTKEHSHGQS